MTARLLLCAVTAVTLSLVAPAPTGAIPNTCPTTGPDAGTVNITEPPAGETFAGQVTVRGRASAPSGLSRVELFVGEALKDFQIFEPPRTDAEFLLQFEVASVQTSTATLSVVACGGTPGAAVRGIASINVNVDRAAVVTAPPMALTPAEGTADPAASGTGTGPAWVGAAFGLAGLVGLVVATRSVRGARVAGAARPRPSPARRQASPKAGGMGRSLGARPVAGRESAAALWGALVQAARKGPQATKVAPPAVKPAWRRRRAFERGGRLERPRRAEGGSGSRGDDGWRARRRGAGWPR